MACIDPWVTDKLDNDLLRQKQYELNALDVRLTHLQLENDNRIIIANRERTLRENNPALQDAWDQYQTILKLIA